MHIREPRDFEAVRSQRQNRHRRKKARHLVRVAFIAAIAVCVVAYGAYLRPLPVLAAKTTIPTVTPEQVALSWPTVGQAAIGVQDQGVMAATAVQKPVPTASVAKVMTALAVLKKHPLKAGEAGPIITMTEADVALYNSYINQGGSAVQVVAGEQMSEYQALQAIMLPSANNIADTLAVWAYGSMSAYHTAANQLAQSLGMTQSTFAGDASGLLPESVSTARDLVLLGQAALKEPALKEIVAQKTAVLPVVGTVNNVNVLLGRAGIIGIKTGNTEEAGGCYLFAATRTLPSGQSITTVGAVAGANSLGQAMTSSLPLLDSFYQGFSSVVVVPKNTITARYTLPWNDQVVTAVTAQDTTVLNWRGSKVTVKASAVSLTAPQPKGKEVGTLTAQSTYGQTSTPLVISTAVPAPTWQWRIFRR